jgi:hypothetical protein
VSEVKTRSLFRSPWFLWIVGAFVLFDVLLVGGYYLYESSWQAANAKKLSHSGKNLEHTGMVLELDGIRFPKALSAAEAGLKDDEEVVGVEAGGKARAYRLKGMSTEVTHVVNDLLGDVPVTVAYCDISDCARAFTKPGSNEALSFGIAGLRDRDLVLKTDAGRFALKSGAPVEPTPPTAKLPYEDYPFARTTWKAWREKHPDTDVFIGIKAGF